MKTHKQITGFTATAVAFTFAGTLEAGQIVGFSWSSGIASIAGEPIDPPVAPNNDNVVGASPNEIVVTQKDFFGVNGVADIVFSVIDSGGTTEYLFIEGVSNSSGIDWDEYRIELGFGEGVDFVPSTPGDGLDFDTPDEDSPRDFSVFFPLDSLPDEDTILAEGGIFPYLAFTTPPFVFSVDVPDGIDSFTIRQTPFPVPEPAGIALLSTLAVAALNRRRLHH